MIDNLEIVEVNETPQETLLRQVKEQADSLSIIVATLRNLKNQEDIDYLRYTNISGIREIGVDLIVLARDLERAQDEVIK